MVAGSHRPAATWKSIHAHAMQATVVGHASGRFVTFQHPHVLTVPIHVNTWSSDRGREPPNDVSVGVDDELFQATVCRSDDETVGALLGCQLSEHERHIRIYRRHEFVIAADAHCFTRFDHEVIRVAAVGLEP